MLFRHLNLYLFPIVEESGDIMYKIILHDSLDAVESPYYGKYFRDIAVWDASKDRIFGSAMWWSAASMCVRELRQNYIEENELDYVRGISNKSQLRKQLACIEVYKSYEDHKSYKLIAQIAQILHPGLILDFAEIHGSDNESAVVIYNTTLNIDLDAIERLYFAKVYVIEVMRYDDKDELIHYIFKPMTSLEFYELFYSGSFATALKAHFNIPPEESVKIIDKRKVYV